MNKEEAIEILSEMRSEYNLFGDEEEATRYHVLSWAIKEMNAEPVVRCRDCKYSYTDENTLVCGYRGFVVSESFYCADGEKKDGADDAAD